MTSPESLMRTPLYDRHVALGARIVPFAGWEMPVQYTGIIQEHNTVRQHAGLFDLGHMGQVNVSGADALPYLQSLTTNDVSQLAPGDAQYSMLTNPAGGVIDDIIVYRWPDRDGYMVVVNASNRDKDVQWMQDHQSRDAEVRDISAETGMIAIQGPAASAITQSLCEQDLSEVDSFQWKTTRIAGTDAMAARTGYTGEDGFEFYTAIDQIGQVWDALIDAGESAGLTAIGLGARDTLRLEARMPLYGNELADDISPLEAGLGWAVKLDKGPFVGSEPIAAMKQAGAPRRTVGFHLTERAGSPRSHYPVLVDDKEIGYVTSGALSPTLGENIGLALIAADKAGIGKPFQIGIHKKFVNAEQVKVPFYRRED